MKVTFESCVFAHGNKATLLFRPSGPVHLTNPATAAVFEEGIDFTVENNTILRTPASRIPVLTEEDIYPSENVRFFPAENANALEGGPDGKYVRYDGLDFFASKQFEAEYETDEAWPEELFRKSPYAPELPVRKIVTLGDSITEGCNSSGNNGKYPFRKPYAGLVAEALGAELCNLAKAGESVLYLQKCMEDTIALKPDLITIAFGMNDLTGMNAEQYVAEVDRAVQIFRKELPDTALLCISAMSGNPEWKCTPVENSRVFAAALGEYAAREKIAFADVFRVWTYVLEHKDYLAMTSNGVNHPSDFGYALYAKTVLNTLGVKA